LYFRFIKMKMRLLFIISFQLFHLLLIIIHYYQNFKYLTLFLISLLKDCFHLKCSQVIQDNFLLIIVAYFNFEMQFNFLFNLTEHLNNISDNNQDTFDLLE
jgi:hypothetical protein